MQGGAGAGDGFGEVGTLGFVGNVDIVFGGAGYLVPLVCSVGLGAPGQSQPGDPVLGCCGGGGPCGGRGACLLYTSWYASAIHSSR